jgi:hypothetical protein
MYPLRQGGFVMLNQNIQKSHSLIFRRVATLLLFSVFSGCRLGSYVEAPARAPNPDKISGYYSTQPQTLKLFATTAQTHEESGAISMIPQEVGQFITNPVALIIQDLTTGSAALTSPTGKHALPIYVNEDSTLTYHGKTASMTYWQDPECQYYLEISENGKFTKTPPIATPSGSDLPLSGKLELTIQVINKFQGNCAASFTLISKCYQDVNDCGGKDSTENEDLQAIVIELLDPWIQSKAILPADIPNLVNYAYEVSYQ